MTAPDSPATLEPSAGPVPLLSVIVPCYNYGGYVAEALRSILAQDYGNFELIVVDDGSTDDSSTVIARTLETERAGSLVRRIEFIRQDNQGVSAALNAGLARARGTYVATFDADDVMPPGRLKLQAAYLDQHPQVGCLGGAWVRIDERGVRLPKKTKQRPVRRYDFAKALQLALVVGGNIAAYRRDAMLAVNGYDPSIKIQDLQMTLRIAHAGYFIDLLPDVVTLYRKHPDSLSANYKQQYQCDLTTIQPYSQYPGYPSAKARLITRALKTAVTDDKAYAWRLLRQIPLSQWDRRVWKRLRHLLFKWPRQRRTLAKQRSNSGKA